MKRSIFVACVAALVASCTSGTPAEDMDAAMMDGTMMDGAMMDGAMMDGAMMDGTMLDGTVIDAPSQDAVSSDTSGGEDATMPPQDASPSLGLDANDMELFTLINDYRESRGLTAIPLSPSLSEVARQHVMDCIDNNPVMGACNLHSWSDAGEWSACCYTPDHAEASCMWNKPRELTDYPGNGYEISTSGARDPARALALWQSSAGHHDVIINEGIWSEPWNAIGVAITPGAFAHVWFGREVDPAL